MHEAFTQIWGTDRLWCSHDRVRTHPPLQLQAALPMENPYCSCRLTASWAPQVSIHPPCRDPVIVADPRREARGVHWDNGQLRLA